MRKKALALAVAVVVVGLVVAWLLLLRDPFPPESTPEGAYARIALCLAEGRERDMFPYLETEAQWGAFTVRDMRSKALARIDKSYPEPQRSELLAAYRAEGEAADGHAVFVMNGKKRGWIARLRKDLSGVAKTEVDGERATVITARGTRYPFRRGKNGVWGLTLFTAELVADGERAARDLLVVNAAADDYDRAKH